MSDLALVLIVAAAATGIAAGVAVGVKMARGPMTDARRGADFGGDFGGDLGGAAVGVAEAARDAARAAVDEALRHMNTMLVGERERSGAHLDHKKELIDEQLRTMGEQLGSLTDLVVGVERDRHRSFGELTEQLRQQHVGVADLTATAQQLREVLASAKVRGQWGERMADDILRFSGLIEGLNYRKQKGIATVAGGHGIPDFTFFLPNGRLLHMDVKFPLDNYARYVEAASDLERKQYRDAFVRDVRARVKELTTRGYLDNDDAVDCLLLFIPNESVYAFIHEHDPELLDHALGQKIVVCSPLTLYAVLAVVRQAVENFTLERQAKEILVLLGQFEQQWNKYTDKLDKVQRSFNTVHRDYDELMTTRHRALARPLDKLAQLRRDEGLSLVEPDDDVLALEA